MVNLYTKLIFVSLTTFRTVATIGYMPQNEKGNLRFTRRDILKLAGTTGVALGLLGCGLDPIKVPTPAELPTLTSDPSITETITPSPTETITPSPTETATPKSEWQLTIETQDPEAKYFRVEDGKPVIDLYDTTAKETIILNQETIQIVQTTDGLNPDSLIAMDADGARYAFNPDHGWFSLPEVQMDYADLSKYTEVEEDFFYDGRNNIVRALHYEESPDKISPDAHPIYWVSARSAPITGDLVLSLSYFPVLKDVPADIYWPEEYQKSTASEKAFVFSGFYKAVLKGGGYVYVIDRTFKLDNTHTFGLANGFDSTTYEKMNIYIGTYPGLYLFFEKAKDLSLDFVTIIPPPEHFPDGASITYDPFTVTLEKSLFNPTVAGLQGTRGSLLRVFSEEDQQRIFEVMTEWEYRKHGYIEKETTPLTSPSALVNLANYILLTSTSSLR